MDKNMGSGWTPEYREPCEREVVRGWRYNGREWQSGRAFDILHYQNGGRVLEVKHGKMLLLVPVKDILPKLR